MKQILLLTVIIGIIIGCSIIKPAVQDSVKKEISVKQTEVPEVVTEKRDDKINVTKTEEKKISPEKISYTLSNINIAEKNNGVLIQLNYEGNDPKENINTFFSGDNFFNITFYKGKFSNSIKNFIYNKSVVRSVKFFEFKDSVQITFRLKEDYNSSFVSTDKKNITISVFN